MAKSAIIGGDVAHMVRIVDMAPRSEFWGTDKPLSAYAIHVDAGRAVGMQVDLMISPVADHEGWRVVAIHAHRDRKSGVSGKSVAVRVDLGRRRNIKKKKPPKN